MADSLSSELSSYPSSEFGNFFESSDCEPSLDALPDHGDILTAPPAKRQRTAIFSHQSNPVSQRYSKEDASDTSSDTSGGVPWSPERGGDPFNHEEQVTVCQSMNPFVGDLHNMDCLVQHVKDEYIKTQMAQKRRFCCKWQGCSQMNWTWDGTRALRVHVRIHTGDRPFYRALPGKIPTFVSMPPATAESIG